MLECIWRSDKIQRYLYPLLASIIPVLLLSLLGKGLSGYVDAPANYLPILYLYWGGISVWAFCRAYKEEIRREYHSRNLETLVIGLCVLGLLGWVFTQWITRIAELLLLALGLYSFFLAKGKLQYSMPHPMRALILMYALSCIGLLWTDHFRLGVGLLDRQVMLLLMPVTSMLLAIKRENLVRIALMSFRIAISLLVFYVLMYLFFATFYTENLWDFYSLSKYYLSRDPSIEAYHYFLVWTRTEHPSLIFVFWGSFWLMGYYLYCRYRSVASLELVVYFVLLLFFVLTTHTRSGALGLLFLGVLPIYHWGKSRCLSVHSSRVLYLFMGLGILGVGWMGARMLSHDVLRVALYSEAICTIARHLPWGLGSGADRIVYYDIYEHVHGHNILISSMTDFGLLGLCSQLYLWGSIAYLYWKKKNRILAWWGILLLPMAVTESPFYISSTVPLLALLFFLFTQKGWEENSYDSKPLC